MIVLALDTALEACSVAIVEDGRVLAARSEPMPRGHQERLASLVAELAAEAGISLSRVDRIGVSVGPGSFTGLRVGLAFAKGLGAALDRPVVGVGTLEALAGDGSDARAAVIDARRGQVYVQGFEAAAATPPQALAVEDAVQALVALGPRRLIGSGAALLAPWFPDAEAVDRAGADPVRIAALAAARPPEAPRPIYLRAPDAKLPGGRTLEDAVP